MQIPDEYRLQYVLEREEPRSSYLTTPPTHEPVNVYTHIYESSPCTQDEHLKQADVLSHGPKTILILFTTSGITKFSWD